MFVDKFFVGVCMQSRKITPEDVKWAYRLLLEREPESHAVVLHNIDHCVYVRDLVENLLNSDEYKSLVERSSTRAEAR